MLVLTRSISESIRIGDDIVIEVVSCGRGSVRLGIQAPRSVKIARSELTEQPPAEPVRRAEAPETVSTPRPKQTVLPYAGTVS